MCCDVCVLFPPPIIPCVPYTLSIDVNGIDWGGWKKHAFILRIMLILIKAVCKFQRICMRLSQLSKIQPAECQEKTIWGNTDKFSLSQRLHSLREVWTQFCLWLNTMWSAEIKDKLLNQSRNCWYCSIPVFFVHFGHVFYTLQQAVLI